MYFVSDVAHPRTTMCLHTTVCLSLCMALALSLSLSLHIRRMQYRCDDKLAANRKQISIYIYTHTYTRYIYVYIVNGFKKNRSSTCIKTTENLKIYTVSLCLFLVLIPTLSHCLSALPAGSPVCVRRCGGTLEGEPQLLRSTSVFVLLYQ